MKPENEEIDTEFSPLEFTESEYDLRGSAGNVFAVMGTVERILKEFGREQLLERYSDEAMAGDYKNAIFVSDRYVQFNWIFPEGDEWEAFEQQLLDARGDNS
jgi:hypothetical protein